MPLKPIIFAALLPVFLFTHPLSWAQDDGSAKATGSAAGQTAEPSTPSDKTKSKRKKLFPDDVAGLQQLAITSYEEGNYLRFMQATMKLRGKRPYEPQYLAGMVIGAALLGRPTTAYDYMHKMQQQGLAYDFNTTEDTVSIRNTEVYTYINELLIRAGEPMGEGSAAFTLAASPAQPEAIVWDASRERFLIGTVDSGAILAVSPQGETQELIRANDENGMWAVTGLAIDAERNRLWVSSAALPGFDKLTPTDLGRGALFEFNLHTLEKVGRYFIPVDGLPHVPGSVQVTPNGDVYVIDRAMPMLFRKAADADALHPYLANKSLVGFRDMALSDTGTKLYLADAAMGILVVDLERQVSAMLSGPESLNLGGLSGLVFNQGALLILQNGIQPQRLMRLKLDATGMAVSEAEPVAIALELFNAPSFGTVHGDSIYYFASSNLPGANDGPAITTVVKSPTVLEQGIVSAEQRQFDADLKAKKEGPGEESAR